MSGKHYGSIDGTSHVVLAGAVLLLETSFWQGGLGSRCLGDGAVMHGRTFAVGDQAVRVATWTDGCVLV